MSLPIISTPKYVLDLPSTGKSVEYRPFLVKEEKILLIAQESQDQKEIMESIKDVIRACTFDKLNPDTMTSFDLEYVFIKLRSKSVGEISNIGLSCPSCSATNPIEINLDEITVKIDPSINKRISLTDTIGVNMKYISVKDLTSIASRKNSTQTELLTDTVIACIDSIYDDKTIYPKDNSTYAELESFINSLNRSQMQKIESFVESMPKVQHVVNFKCKSCGADHALTLSGVESFFGLPSHMNP